MDIEELNIEKQKQYEAGYLKGCENTKELSVDVYTAVMCVSSIISFGIGAAFKGIVGIILFAIVFIAQFVISKNGLKSQLKKIGYDKE